MSTGDPICPRCHNYIIHCKCDQLRRLMSTPEDFVPIPVTPAQGMFSVVNKSLFDMDTKALTNTINCVGIMGAGIALEFKKRFPAMFFSYKEMCKQHQISPGDCYTYFDEQKNVYVLNLAVKNDWKHWGTLEWLEHSLKSLKLSILENEIKSVALPLLGGQNGRRGPYGKIPNMTIPPEKDELKQLIKNRLEPFAEKFGVDVVLCIPEKNISVINNDNEFFA